MSQKDLHWCYITSNRIEIKLMESQFQESKVESYLTSGKYWCVYRHAAFHLLWLIVRANQAEGQMLCYIICLSIVTLFGLSS